MAALQGHTETVQAIAACGADPSATDDTGCTPVRMAAQAGETETVLALAELGADASTPNKNGITPVWVAAWFGHSETLRALVRQCGVDPLPALRKAARDEDARMIWALVCEGGADPTSLDSDGTRPRDLVPRGLRAYELLRWLEESHHMQPVYAGANERLRAAEFECPVCSDTKDDAIAFAPCGHRLCAACWARVRAHGAETCPMCRAPVLHSAPPKSFPDERKLFSRFCVEVPRAGR